MSEKKIEINEIRIQRDYDYRENRRFLKGTISFSNGEYSTVEVKLTEKDIADLIKLCAGYLSAALTLKSENFKKELLDFAEQKPVIDYEEK